MVVRAAERWNPGLLSEPLAAYESTWGDFDSDHAANARKAEYNGIFHYDLSQYNPYGPMTREAVAQVLNAYLSLIRIPPVTSRPSAVLSPQVHLHAASGRRRVSPTPSRGDLERGHAGHRVGCRMVPCGGFPTRVH